MTFILYAKDSEKLFANFNFFYIMNDKIKYFIPKVKNHIPSYVAKLFKYLPINKISYRGIDSISGKTELIRRLDKMLGASLNEILSIINKNEQQSILEHANKAMLHYFNVLGSGMYKMETINWNQDIITGFKWPIGVFYLNIRSLTPKGSDIKIPWEISRCHHLLWMSEAYCLTNDESYSKEVIQQIHHWILHNPFMYSVNWTCAMDVSIRAINWIYALSLISKSKAFSDKFAKEVYYSLYQHLFFIYRNQEKCIPYSNNHYFSNIVGMLFLGQLFSTTKYGRHIFNYAFKEYCKEVCVQILPSGVNYEKSVSYHRLMTELVMYSYYMLKRTRKKIPNDITDRLSRMLGYINQYTITGGNSPIISDNDNGRLLPFVPRPFQDHSYLINKDSLDNRIASITCQWIAPTYESNKSCIHEDANLAILKKSSLYVYISCFDRCKYDSYVKNFTYTHLHNDLLSFVFADENTPIIVDAGSYCYTSNIDIWKSFRTAKKHNTIIVDDEEPNILGNSTFMMKYNANAKIFSMSSRIVEHCEGEYTTIAGQMTHHRAIDLSSNSLKITDILTKKNGIHKAYMSYHFANEIDAILENNKIRLASHNGKEYNMTFISISPLSMRIIHDNISPSYGVLIPTKTLIIEFEFEDNVKCVTNIEKLK